MSIQYFEHPLAKGISTLGSAIGKGIETYGQKKQEIDKQQQIGSALQSVVGESGEVKSLEDEKAAIQTKLAVDLDAIKQADLDWDTLTNTQKINILKKPVFAVITKYLE